MCHFFFRETSFFARLIEIDHGLAREAKANSCQHCGGKLDVSNYMRKPRCYFGDFSSAFSKRFSFCCRERGCRKRLTPSSVRFFGRKVFWSMILLLAAAQLIVQFLRCKPSRLVRRWQRWWHHDVSRSSGWQVIRSHFLFPEAEALPFALLVGQIHDQESILQVLTHLSSCMKPPDY